MLKNISLLAPIRNTLVSFGLKLFNTQSMSGTQIIKDFITTHYEYLISGMENMIIKVIRIFLITQMNILLSEVLINSWIYFNKL